jgi:hypothetical protein
LCFAVCNDPINQFGWISKRSSLRTECVFVQTPNSHANRTTIGIANSLARIRIPSDPTISHVLDILRRQTG